MLNNDEKIRVYGISVDGQTMYSTKYEVVVREAFAMCNIDGIDYDKAFKDIQLLRENISVYEREELRNKGLLNDYYGKNFPFHMACQSVFVIQPGKTKTLKITPELEFLSIEMTKCELCKLPEFDGL